MDLPLPCEFPLCSRSSRGRVRTSRDPEPQLVPVRSAGRLSHLDQVPVGISHVTPNLSRVHLRWRQELRAALAPARICLVDVGHAQVERAGKCATIARCHGDDVRLVVCRAARLRKDQSAIVELQDSWWTFHQRLCAECVCVEATRAVHIADDEHVRDHNICADTGAWPRPHGRLRCAGRIMSFCMPIHVCILLAVSAPRIRFTLFANPPGSGASRGFRWTARRRTR
jgi:hypothetical protein